MENMLRRALRENIGRRHQLEKNLLGDEGEVWEREFKKFLRREPCWGDEKSTPVAPTPSLLELVSTVRVAATTSKFVAKKKFVRDTGRKAKVRISGFSSSFDNWFLSGPGKIEDPITAQTLRCHKLCRSSPDGPIITELGGEAKVETTLTELFSLMEKQKHGEAGVLLTNGWANIFYIRDRTGVLRAVDVRWFDDGWRVNAHEFDDPDWWFDGRQVFSRNSALEPSETSVPAQSATGG